MTKFSNSGVIELFVKGLTGDYKEVESHTGNLWVSYDGKRLMNYSTCLVEKNADYGWIVNRTSYSVTTSKIQGYIGSALWQRFSGEWIAENVIYVDSVQQSTNYLDDAAKAKLEWMKGIKPVKLINYFDVWGNKKDGWEINNLCEENAGELFLHEECTHKDILQKLKEVGFLKSTTRMNQLVFEGLGDFGVEIYQKKDMQPICRIEFVHEMEVNK
jgi:hypothetical protein